MEAISLIFKEVSSNPRKPQPKDVFTLSVRLSLGMTECTFVSHEMKATNYPARKQGTEAKERLAVYTTYQMGVHRPKSGLLSTLPIAPHRQWLGGAQH